MYDYVYTDIYVYIHITSPWNKHPRLAIQAVAIRGGYGIAVLRI